MEDNEIVDLYWERNETAISETEKKYGRYCYVIAYNILYSHEDTEECVNDTYLRAWETIPPQRPAVLNGYLGKITRNLALNRYEYIHADKRDARVTEVYDESTFALSGDDSDPLDELALKEAINSFLAALPKEHRIVFIRRYWYMSEVAAIAKDYRIPEGTVKSILSRTRMKFKKHLEKEGIQV